MDDDNDEQNDPLARMDAEFILVSGTIRKLLHDLKKALGGYT